MGLFKEQRPVHATFGEIRLRCPICQHDDFWRREIKLNTTGAELMGLAFANPSAMGLICTSCGHIMEFLGDAITLWKTPETAG